MDNQTLLRFCSQCGRENVEHGKFCPQCGHSLVRENQPTPQSQPKAEQPQQSQPQATVAQNTAGQATVAQSQANEQVEQPQATRESMSQATANPQATSGQVTHTGNQELMLNLTNLGHIGVWIHNNLVTAGLGVLVLFLLFTFTAAHIVWWLILLLLVILYLVAGIYGTGATRFEQKVNRYYQDPEYRTQFNQNIQAKTASTFKQSTATGTQPSNGQAGMAAPTNQGSLTMGLTEIMVVLGSLAVLGSIYVGPYFQASESFFGNSTSVSLAKALQFGNYFSQNAMTLLVILTVLPIVTLVLGILPSRIARIINIVIAIINDIVYILLFSELYNEIGGGVSNSFFSAGYGISAWITIIGCIVVTVFAFISVFKKRQ
ncbi:zinc-ribbon domain-containing protein [Levilactobacillus tongjiangensis]|uniref:Zinc-ribbon domain-containing protein n=1 Tax=Levilactobacillus tongjiangensis TaxID=2486023 RepID=A0ABW1SSG4_9LACO|nr:zinc ribbon domain-containing protein [Levilactobacillus tongjiangensis]